jgi:hypothetical protein
MLDMSLLTILISSDFDGKGVGLQQILIKYESVEAPRGFHSTTRE